MSLVTAEVRVWWRAGQNILFVRLIRILSLEIKKKKRKIHSLKATACKLEWKKEIMYVCLIFFVNVFHLTKIILEARLINKKFKIVLIILEVILCALHYSVLLEAVSNLQPLSVPSAEVYISPSSEHTVLSEGLTWKQLYLLFVCCITLPLRCS